MKVRKMLDCLAGMNPDADFYIDVNGELHDITPNDVVMEDDTELDDDLEIDVTLEDSAATDFFRRFTGG